MSGIVPGMSGSYGEEPELQRQYEEYQRRNPMHQGPPPPPGMTMGIPPDYYSQHHYHHPHQHLHRVPSGASGGSPPTLPTPYVPQNYGAANQMGGHPPPLMSSSPLIMAQGMPPYAAGQHQPPPPHHHHHSQPHQGLPPPMLAYGGMPPGYPPHYPVPAGAYPYPPPPMAAPSVVAGSSAAAGGTDIATAGSAEEGGAAAMYAHPEPLTHPRAPKSAATMEQIQLMQDAFKREQDTSRRRHQSSYAEAAARRAVRIGVKPSEYSTGMQSSASASPTSSAGSMQSSSAGGHGFVPHDFSGGGSTIMNASKARLPTIITKRKDAAVLDQDADGRMIVKYTDGDEFYYMGSAPLGVEDDKYWLSELQVYLRSNFAEAFSASEEDIAVLMHGRNKPISLGQIGIRCIWCKHDNPEERGQQATSYPSQIGGIYNSVQQMLRLHLDCCLSMPREVRDRIEYLKISCSSRGGRKQYWVDSAKRIGLVDTPTGIHFARDPAEPLPPLAGPSVAARDATALRKKRPPVALPNSTTNMPRKPLTQFKAKPFLQDENIEDEFAPLDINMPSQPPPDAAPIVFPEDKPLISDYLYLTMEQMAPCALMEADRVGCYKARKVGFPGMACRHCVGQAGCGRYFPASEASLSQTTTSQTILNHVRNCRRCPAHIRDELEIMKRERLGPDGKRYEKPKHGGRKVFFHRLWCRIQGLDIDDEDDMATDLRSRKKGRRKRGDDDDDEEEDDEDDADSAAASCDNQVSSSEKAKGKRSSPNIPKIAPWVHGCVRLTKADDKHWLSEMECFARTELVEVFTYSQDDPLYGYAGRKKPSEGQIGVRCVYCKDSEPHDRTNGCILFPGSIESLHSKSADMVRLHFPSCCSLPDGVRQTFKALRGFDAKVSTDDSHHYWIDAASDIGISNSPPGGSDSWGITFRRDPLEPSPADELDMEANSFQRGALAITSLEKLEDRGTCTDQVILLMRQIQPCRFSNSDKRGTVSRGRARVIGFPGLCCRHCDGHSTQGRYFPPSAKNLIDSTVNSLLTHVMSCNHCPLPVRASLAYLGHRAIQQKAELSGSWKKNFFQKIWDRLHVDMEWAAALDEPADGNAELSDSNNQTEMYGEEDSLEDPNHDNDAGEEQGEPGGDQMNALIKAAAIWLTEQDSSKTGEKRGNDGTPGSVDSIEESEVKRRRAV